MENFVTRHMNGHLYRLGVGLILFNEIGHVLIGQRTHATPNSDIWQLPQGGQDPGERPRDAIRREVWEEINLTVRDEDFLDISLPETSYLLPETYRTRGFDGQIHTWFAALSPSREIPDFTRARDQEFRAMQWASTGWILDHTDAFRREPYKQVLPLAFQAFQMR